MRKLILSFCFIVSVLFGSSATYARSMTWLEVAEGNLYRQSGYGNWTCRYVVGSARGVSILERDNAADYTLISVRYDYRCGDSTLSDTAYMSFKNVTTDIMITCIDYKSQSGACTIDGAHYKTN